MHALHFASRRFSTAATKTATQSTQPTRNVTIDNISKAVIKAEYAVRGLISIKSIEIRRNIENGVKYPFDGITECNIGNPQLFGQKPISFNRQVLGLLLNPDGIASSNYHNDVKDRARFYTKNIEGNIGAYSESVGFWFARKNIARFISERDGFPSDPDNIIISDGASGAIHNIMSTLVTGPQDGIMIPIPQYPLYTALIALENASEVPYYLEEENGWQINVEDLQRSYDEGLKKGIRTKAMVVINPGNPTGQILKEDTIRKIIEFCSKNGIVVLADEVYQENIYKNGAKFVSFKKVMSSLPAPYNQLELFSFHSISKGFLGECGIRGGYVEAHNIDPAVWAQIIKLKTINLCSNTMGQVSVDLMVNPPNQKENSKEIYEQYVAERDGLKTSLKKRAQIVGDYLNKMKNVTCNEVEGAMYAFPQVKLSNKVIEEAKKRNQQPDMFYCLQALEKTGIACVPGSGFRQKPGTHHFRMTTLILPEERMLQKLQEFHRFNDWFHNEYAQYE